MFSGYSVPLDVAFRRFCPSYIWTRGHSTVFVFHLTREFSVFFRDSSNFWQQIFQVSGVWTVFKARGLRRVFCSLDMTFSRLLRNFFDADSNRKRVGLDGPLFFFFRWILDSDGLLFDFDDQMTRSLEA
ncbi:unnamed protein product [Rhizophagus irregularis]|nr:unnamed protein product [Rhizophagus irregularis]